MNLPDIRNKIIEFQKTIIELKRTVRELRESAAESQRRHLLEQLEWYESLKQICSDMQAPISDPSSVSLVQVNTTKSMQRLIKKMWRYFEANAITVVQPKNVSDEPDSIKVVEVQSVAHLPDGHVLETIRTGYRWKDIILRKSEVISVCHSSNVAEKSDLR